MPVEDKNKAIEKAAKRLAKRTGKVSPEMYLVAEAGYYWGWSAIEAIKRGYIEYKDEDGNEKKSILTLEEVSALIDATNKVWYSKVIDQSAGTFSASVSAWSKNPGSSFKSSMQPFVKEAEI